MNSLFLVSTLHKTIENNDYYETKRLLNAGADINIRTKREDRRQSYTNALLLRYCAEI